MAKAWMPGPEVQAWLRATYSYDPTTGFVLRGGEPVRAHIAAGYWRTCIRNVELGASCLLTLHRLAWFLHTGSFHAGDIDHINHDRLDNRIENLRATTRSQNARNGLKRSMRNGRPTTSQFKGVYFDSEHQKWAAGIGIRVDGKPRHKRLGRFDCEATAAHAYDTAAMALYGEHACTNFPQRSAA